MNTISTTQKLQSLVSRFEQDSGSTIPSVMPLVDLYRDYCDCSRSNDVPVQKIESFLFHLTRHCACMPCWLPDGNVGVIGINLKAMMASGVLQ